MTSNGNESINGSRVVRTSAGPATGETIRYTADGRRWTDNVKQWDYNTTGVTVSQIRR